MNYFKKSAKSRLSTLTGLAIVIALLAPLFLPQTAWAIADLSVGAQVWENGMGTWGGSVTVEPGQEFKIYLYASNVSEFGTSYTSARLVDAGLANTSYVAGSTFASYGGDWQAIGDDGTTPFDGSGLPVTTDGTLAPFESADYKYTVRVNNTLPAGTASLDWNTPTLYYSGGNTPASQTGNVQVVNLPSVTSFAVSSVVFGVGDTVSATATGTAGKTAYATIGSFTVLMTETTSGNYSGSRVVATGDDVSATPRLFLVDGGGKGAYLDWGESVTIDTGAPSAVTGVSASGTGTSSIGLNWQASGASDFGGYEVYYGTQANVSRTNGTGLTKNTSGYANLGNINTTSLSVSGLAAGATYYAVVYACDLAGNCSAPSATVNATTQSSGGGLTGGSSSGGGSSSPTGGGPGQIAPSLTASSSGALSAANDSVMFTAGGGTKVTLLVKEAQAVPVNVVVRETTKQERDNSAMEPSFGTLINNNLFAVEKAAVSATTTFPTSAVLAIDYDETKPLGCEQAKLRVAYHDTVKDSWQVLPTAIKAGSVEANAVAYGHYALACYTGGEPNGEVMPDGSILGSTAGAYPDGALLKAPGSSTVWRIMNGQKHAIPSAQVFESQFNWDDIVYLPSLQQIDLYELGDNVKFAAGSIVKENNDPTVYRISADGGKQAFVSEEIFYANGYSYAHLINGPAGSLSQYPEEAMISQTGVYFTGDTVSPRTTGDVYYIEQGSVRPVSRTVFVERAGANRNILPITSAELARFTAGIPLNFPGGTLVKGTGPTIYFVTDGTKRPIRSARDFEALRFSWSNIILAPASLLDTLLVGDEIAVVAAE